MINIETRKLMKPQTFTIDKKGNFKRFYTSTFTYKSKNTGTISKGNGNSSTDSLSQEKSL